MQATPFEGALPHQVPDGIWPRLNPDAYIRVLHCDGAPLAPAARAAVVCQPSCACTRPPSASDGPPSRSLHRSQPFIMTKKRRSGCARCSRSRRVDSASDTVHELAVMSLLLCMCVHA